jgi:DNA-directed RNA polymerase specialized sigma24 family protein
LSNTLPQIVFPAAFVEFRASVQSGRLSRQRSIYEANRHRIFSFAFWMTDSEPMAEHLSERTFLRAFSISDQPDEEMIDRALIRELHSEADILIGSFCLECQVVHQPGCIRRNTRREQLERAIVQLPHTERMIFCMHDGDGYEHERIARTLGIGEDDSRRGLHQARLRIRELVTAQSYSLAA